jgi:hypothetical protein
VLAKTEKRTEKRHSFDNPKCRPKEIIVSKTATRTVRYEPPGAERGKWRTVAIEVNDRTTTCQLLKELGLKRCVLLPMGNFPGLPGGARVLDVELDPKRVAQTGADFVAVTAAEDRKIARLQRSLVAFFETFEAR